jgi:hypothetical protein
MLTNMVASFTASQQMGEQMKLNKEQVKILNK